MIVKSAADAARFISQEGVCGVGSVFCSQSCEKHGAHVAVTGDGQLFAIGASSAAVQHTDQRQTVDLANAA